MRNIEEIKDIISQYTKTKLETRFIGKEWEDKVLTFNDNRIIEDCRKDLVLLHSDIIINIDDVEIKKSIGGLDMMCLYYEKRRIGTLEFKKKDLNEI